MGTQYRREEVLTRLYAVRQSGLPILAVCPGSGLNAKLCELGGADIIALAHTGAVRQKGLPSITFPDRSTNEIVRQMMADQFHATKEIPIICGIDVSEISAHDDLDSLIDSSLSFGFSGVMNYPTSGEIASEEFLEVAQRGEAHGAYQVLQRESELKMFEVSRAKEREGVGFTREIELIHRARQRNIFTMVYAFTPGQAAKMARAGADCICGHCGGTGGGLVGHAETASHKSASQRLQEMLKAARVENPDVLFLGHGGPFAMPEDVAQMYQYSQVDGFLAGSAIDRIPVERAIIQTTREFKQVRY